MNKSVKLVLMVFCSGLILISLVGEFIPLDYRSDLDGEIVSYDQTIKSIDSLFDRYGDSDLFFEHSVSAYTKGISYVWEEKYCRIPFYKNYLFFGLSFFDNQIKALGLTEVDNLFSVYQSTDYHYALGRGFGICSQNAMGYSDLILQRYGLKSYVVGLTGHVIVSVPPHKQTKSALLDPSLGIYIPQSLSKIESDLNVLDEIYADTSFPELVKTFNKEGNKIALEAGSKGYLPKLYILERSSQILKYGIPLILIFILQVPKLKLKRREK